jgi:hypothetical protein
MPSGVVIRMTVARDTPYSRDSSLIDAPGRLPGDDVGALFWINHALNGD